MTNAKCSLTKSEKMMSAKKSNNNSVYNDKEKYITDIQKE